MGLLHSLVDAEPVGHGGDGAHGPAGAAPALVAHLPDGRTVRPLLPGVELLRQLLRAQETLLLGRHEAPVAGVYAHQGAEVVGGSGRVEVTPGHPSHSRAGVQVGDEVVRQDVVVVVNGGRGGDDDQQEEPHRFADFLLVRGSYVE